MQFTKRHGGVQENNGEPNNTEQRLTEFYPHEENELTEVNAERGKRDNGIVQEDGEQRNPILRNEQYYFSGGEKTIDKLAAISEEKEESDNEVLKWSISDVFSGLEYPKKNN